MASSSPPILPISNQITPTTTTTTTAPSSPPSPLRVFIASLTDTIHSGLSNRRPWSELLDRTTLSKPESLSDATTRLRKNYAYFRTNYLTIITTILAFSLITNPFSLLLLSALLAAWLFLYLFRTSQDPPLTILGREFTNTETLAGLIFSTVVVIFLTSVGAVLVSALMIGVAVVGAHAVFRAPEDLFVDNVDDSATGFLSFFTGSNSVVSAGVPVVSRA